MRKLSVLCAAFFCLSITAFAQDSTAAFDASTSASEPAAPASLIPADRDPWQLGVGFEYLHFNVLGQKFHDFGYQAGITRYLTNWFGVEGTAIAGFGNLANNSGTAKSLFLGGGPHITLGSISHAAFMAGGGVDYKIGGGRLYWRVQGDYLGTNVGPSISNNYSVGTGVVLNF